MRKVIIPIFASLLLILAILPWLVSSCDPQSLVPEDLRQEPLHYESTVTAARAATIDAVRSATSVIQVIPIGTIDLPTVETQVASTSVVRINTVTVVATNSEMANSEASPVGITTELLGTSTPSSVADNEHEGVPPTPIGLIDIEDIITEEQLTERLKTEPEGSDLKDLRVTLSQGGFHIDSVIAVFPVNNQHVVVDGVFVVKNYSLVVNISSITLNGDDVTQSYGKEIESRMDTSLYRLLPERYVQSFIILDGEILVFSKVRR